jgi:hypothetical protein
MFHDNFFYEIDVKDNVDETDEFDENNFRLSIKPCLRIFRNTKDVSEILNFLAVSNLDFLNLRSSGAPYKWTWNGPNW